MNLRLVLERCFHEHPELQSNLFFFLIFHWIVVIFFDPGPGWSNSSITGFILKDPSCYDVGFYNFFSRIPGAIIVDVIKYFFLGLPEAINVDFINNFSRTTGAIIVDYLNKQ